MVTGYPRFFVHLTIQKLASMFEHKYALNGEKCMLFPSRRVAEQCRSFMEARSVSTRLLSRVISPEDRHKARTTESNGGAIENAEYPTPTNLHIVFLPPDAVPIAKQFWQHTGMGISSRLAEYTLSILPPNASRTGKPSPPSSPPHTFFKWCNNHYAVNKPKSISPSPSFASVQKNQAVTDRLDADQKVYIEERYGRNLPLAYAPAAKRALRRRIAGVLIRDNDDGKDEPSAGDKDSELGPSSRGVADVSEKDVYLFPTGMTAIWTAHDLILAVRPPAKSVCFGFPYTDTLKVLQKWGPGCHFFGTGMDSDIDELERLLEQESARDPNTPPVLALFTEFPSNPLLRSANLPRLRALADKHDFLIVIDETIGNFVNVEVLPYADIVVSSLTKVFSGVANVMGGSLVLNPHGRHYAELKTHLDRTYEDNFYDEDAIYMERNSRDFQRRIRLINLNAEKLCDFLYTHSFAGGAGSDAVIKNVFYPKFVTPENYKRCRKDKVRTGGFGGLFSLTFGSCEASRAFYDALECYKGPSLGTNFTLVCPFTILAHYAELDWAAGYGVEEGLVRVTVGMEDIDWLIETFRIALETARNL